MDNQYTEGYAFLRHLKFRNFQKNDQISTMVTDFQTEIFVRTRAWVYVYILYLVLYK